MLIVGKAILSDDLIEKEFVCNLTRCKGGCCVAGDLGAPVEPEERASMEKVYSKVRPYLSDSGRESIERQGTYVLDEEGEYSTPLINGQECAYTVFKDDIALCAIEMAYRDKKIDFKKPISCELYPIRIAKFGDQEALNYDRWDICSPACELGRELRVPVYKFLKEPLIRKYGVAWYEELEEQVKTREKI